MQVKTVKEGCYNVYDITNAFYKSLDLKSLNAFLHFGINGILVRFILCLLNRFKITNNRELSLLNFVNT